MAGGAVAVAVAATTVTAVAFWSPEAAPPIGTVGSPSATTRPSGTIRIDVLPDNIRYGDRRQPYWPESVAPPADAPRLAAAPLSHAVLLAWDATARVFACGEGSINGGGGDGRFRWVRLDVSLTEVRDVAGVVGIALDPNSLGPMGERAAFPQTAVIDDRTATVVHLLDLRRTAPTNCCAVVGWEGPDTVLVHADPEGLLRWHLPTGTVTRLSHGAPTRLSVAPTGCDWSITIDHVTSACPR